jgi:hypothetical protein
MGRFLRMRTLRIFPTLLQIFLHVLTSVRPVETVVSSIQVLFQVLVVVLGLWVTLVLKPRTVAGFLPFCSLFRPWKTILWPLLRPQD